MLHHKRHVFFIALMGVCGSATAETPPDVADLVGARGAGGETQLLARGYELRESSTVRDQRFTFWWSAKRRQCISVSTMDGRYASIQGVPVENCGESSGDSSPAGASSHGDATSLVLVCYGGGARPTLKNQTNYAWDADRKKWRAKDSVQATTESFSSDVQIELYGDHGRIHLSDPLIPPINSHGDHGWWELDNVQVGQDRIVAGYRLNGMNKPRLTVDRRSGRIDIEGGTTFSGQCDIGNYGGGQRRF